jgi:hypothetical protein
VKLIANLQLLPDAEQEHALPATLERCNAACDWISERGFAAGVVKQFLLHKLTYRAARERFGLAARAAVRCIAKVADAYKSWRKASGLSESTRPSPSTWVLRYCRSRRGPEHPGQGTRQGANGRGGVTAACKPHPSGGGT